METIIRPFAMEAASVPFASPVFVQILATERSLDCYKNRCSIPLGKSSGTGVRLVSVDAVTFMLKNVNF